MKPKAKQNLKQPPKPELCVAVRRIRQASKLSQEQLAAIGVASQTLSKFETGKLVPRSDSTLQKFASVAGQLGLPEEQALFEQAISAIRKKPYLTPAAAVVPVEHILATIVPAATGHPLYTPHEWRLMQAARIALRSHPGVARAIEQAAGDVLTLVDEVLGTAAPSSVNAGFYRELEQQINLLAEQRAFATFRKEGR